MLLYSDTAAVLLGVCLPYQRGQHRFGQTGVSLVCAASLFELLIGEHSGGTGSCALVLVVAPAARRTVSERELKRRNTSLKLNYNDA